MPVYLLISGFGLIGPNLSALIFGFLPRLRLTCSPPQLSSALRLMGPWHFDVRSVLLAQNRLIFLHIVSEFSGVPSLFPWPFRPLLRRWSSFPCLDSKIGRPMNPQMLERRERIFSLMTPSFQVQFYDYSINYNGSPLIN